jgi:hypothetical protein
LDTHHMTGGREPFVSQGVPVHDGEKQTNNKKTQTTLSASPLTLPTFTSEGAPPTAI